MVVGSVAYYPAALQPLLQQGFLEAEAEEGLDTILAYRREALQETIPARRGETLTRTRKGRLPVTITPLTPSASVADLDDGLTPVTGNVEQYTLTMYQYAGTTDTDLMQDLFGIANQYVMNTRNLAVQAATTLERLCRERVFAAYNGGNTRVRTDLGASTTTTCHVDDIRGFQYVWVNGVPTGVSSGNPLTVDETAGESGGVTQVLTVTSVVADATNNSSYPGAQTISVGNPTGSDGISGVLTFTASLTTAPVNGDALIASGAAQILRPFGKLTTAQLASGDILTLSIVEDAVAYLRSNAVPPMPDGTYHCVLDNTSMRQLYADQQFMLAYAGRYQSPEFQTGEIVRLMDVTFITTTEAYVQQQSSAPDMQTRVRRPIVMGGESIIQGNFEGLDIYAAREGLENLSAIMLINNIAFVLRPPLGRLGDIASCTWRWIGDFAIPTDQTATTAIIPTASNSIWKRCLVIETAG